MAASTMFYLLTVPDININDALLQFINVLMILTLFNFTRWSTVLDRRCITRLPRINSAEYLTL